MNVVKLIVWGGTLLIFFFATIPIANTAAIRIGALTPLTGSGEPYGPGMVMAIRIAADEINAAGGILDNRVVVFSEDTKTDPNMAVAAARKLIEDHKVCAVLGTWSSGVTMSVLPLTTRAGILEMNVSGAPAISQIGKKTGLVYRTQASNTQFGVVYAEISKRAGFQKAATMAFDNPSGRGNTEEFVRNFKSAGGIVTGGVVYEGGKASYRLELEEVLATKPDVIVLGSYMIDTMIILKEWDRLKMPVHFIAGAWAVNPELIKALGPKITEGIWAVDTVPNTSSKTYVRFAEKFRSVTGRDPDKNPYAPKVYDQMILLALAAEAAQSIDPQVFKTKMREISGPPGELVYGFEEGLAALRAGKQIDFDGASGAIDFNGFGDVSPTFGIFRVENGKLILKYTHNLK
jgi:branched-chain amino acid transport system substrate-binding protein